MGKKASESTQEARTERNPCRTSEYSESVAEEICERLAKGETLRSICRDEHMPAWTTVYNWIRAHEEYAERIARARELGHDAIAEETFEIADEMPPAGPDGKTDSGYVAWQKNRIWTRQQMLARWSPHKYGDRKTVDMNANLQGQLTIVSEFGDGD